MSILRKENGQLVKKAGNVDYSEINELKQNLTWKKVNATATVTTLNQFFNVVVPQIENANEIVVSVGGVGDASAENQIFLIRPITDNSMVLNSYNFLYSNSAYNNSYDVSWTPSTNTVGIRQTVKGSNDLFKQIKGIRYR